MQSSRPWFTNWSWMYTWASPMSFVAERVLFGGAHERLPSQSCVDDVLDIPELERADLVAALPRSKDLVGVDNERLLDHIHFDAFEFGIVVRRFADLKNSNDRHALLSEVDDELYYTRVRTAYLFCCA